MTALMGVSVDFWTIFKADALFALCSFLISSSILIGIALWRRRKARRSSKPMLSAVAALPKVMVIGGKELIPGQCPLCGQSWPLPGPEAPTKGDA